ncbi:MAG: Fe(3+) ABC transporter substrate-binding protein [Nitrospirota bacterium]
MPLIARLVPTVTLVIGLAHAIASAADEVVVYSSRNEQLIKPLFDAYTKETGVHVRFITDKEGPLIERLKAEGSNTPADLLITVDAGNLWFAGDEGLLRAVESHALRANIPEAWRDPDNRWFGLTVRARTIVYNTKRVKPTDLSSYEDLGTAKWKKRLCLRTSKKVYNQSLVAMMIAELGEAKTEAIVRSWVANLATDVFSDDTAMIEAIAAGQCDVGIANTYYFGRFKSKHPDAPVALFWPNQGDRGVHVNVSGGGVTRHSKRAAAAVRLLEWLSSPSAQKIFTEIDFEYPANPSVAPSPTVAAWGTFRSDPINVSKAGELQRAAVMLMDRAGYR